MKALTICQPYPHLIVIGEKPIENRTWSTPHRGALAIHAGKSRVWLDDGDAERYPSMVFGAIVAVADLVAVLSLHSELAWPDTYAHLRDHTHANGPYCWVLENVRPLTRPIACPGALGLWTVPIEIERRIQEAA
jgi:hypothetical protein